MENGKRIRVLTVKYTADIDYHEIPLFRGAVIASMNHEADVLFHNHIDNDKFRYSYPLIQYKRIGGKAAIVCIDAGTDIVGQFLATESSNMLLNEREITLEIDSIMPRQLLVQTWQSDFTYYLNRWLPLNPENFMLYQQTDSMVEKIQLLEKILIGNILSFAKGIKLDVTEQIVAKITNIKDSYTIKTNKHTKLLAFDTEFTCNVSLPNNIGLGKNSSLGFGTVTMRKEKRENKK